MTRKVRRLLFYFLFAAFILIGTLVVFYSMGWRVDLDDFTLKQTGGIFIKSRPREIEIEIDGKKIEQRKWLLVSGTLIKNLLPKTYEVKISKDGFRNWKNEIPVTAKTVSEINNIILLPNDFIFETAASSTKDFWIKEGRLVILNKKLEYKENIFSGSKFIGFLGNDKKAITYDEKQKAYILNDLDKKTTSNLSLIFSNLRKKDSSIKDRSAIEKIITREGNGEEIAIISKEAIYSMNIIKPEITQLEKKTGGSTDIGSERFLILGAGEKITLLDLTSKEKVYQKSIEGESVKRAELNEIQNAGILMESGNLFYIKGTEIKQIAEGVSVFALNQRDKIIFLDKDKKIKIYNAEKDKTIEMEVLNPENILSLNFLEDNHILAEYSDAIYLLETASENLELKDYSFYFERVAGFSEAINKFYLDKDNKEIYILDGEGNLKKSDYFKN
ncbi:MAG: PEGA domain-containing protein [Candidatus Pacebacteria bacterium]|nr:PEGA domain-containing protein [Candidatus Paceibacterota bacterium]